MSQEFVGPDRSLVQGNTKIIYRIALDQEKLAQMALKANISKGSKSVDGPCSVSIIERRPR